MTKARVNADNASADIQGVTAGTGLTGGGTSGTVTLTNDMATVIDAKGDLVVGTGADTYDNLAVGNNGETLVADSSATTGLRWTATPSSYNPVLNSCFDIWQRGTSVTGAGGGAYTADRWFLYAGGQITVSRQATGDTTNLPNIQYCARVQRNNASADTTNFSFGQSFETVNSIPFAGKTITYSFYARKGANYSSASNTLGVLLTSGTGTDQNKQSAGYTGNSDIINTNVTLTGTWQRFTFTGLSVAATATELCPFFSFTPVGTAGAADYYEVTGVQIDIGNTALPVRRNAGTIQGELAACQRYYCRWTGGAAYHPYGLGFATSTTAGAIIVNSPVAMRVAPTTIDYSTIYLEDYASASSTAGTVSAFNAGPLVTKLNFTGLSGMTAGRGIYIYSNNDANGYLAFSAEL
jgi:hypothetical protein